MEDTELRLTNFWETNLLTQDFIHTMKTKQQIIEGLVKPTYSVNQIKEMLDSLPENPSFKPNKIKRGDVFLNFVGTKLRPCVALRIVKGIVWGIPLTTTGNIMALKKVEKSRFYQGNFFVNGIVSCKEDVAIKFWAGVLDSPRELNQAVGELKNILNKL